MSRRTRATQPDQHAPSNGRGGAMTLDRLLEAERELAVQVEGAREEAARIHESVQERLRDLEREAEAALQAALAALAESTRTAADREVREVTEAARAIVARYAAEPDETVGQLAAGIVDEFLGEGRPGASGP